MEIIKENSTSLERLEVDAKPVQNEVSKWNNDPLSDATHFKRGDKATMSLDRDFKSQKSQEFGKFPERTTSMRSVADGSIGGFWKNIFSSKNKKDKSNSSKSKKDTHTTQISQLKKEIASLKSKSAELDNLREENSSLTHKNTLLRQKEAKLQKEIEQLKHDKESLERSNKEIRFTVEEALKNYDKALFEESQCVEYLNVENLQIGSGNIQNITNIDTDTLKGLLSQCQEQLKSIMKDREQAKYNLQMAKTLQEQMGNEIISLKDALVEVKEALLYVRSINKQDVSMDLLDYTISWTDPNLMAECVDELQNLPEKSDGYKFKDLKGNAKVGVLRIFMRYETRLNFKRFVQLLEMEDHVSAERMSADLRLEKDDCATLLVKWVKLDQENNGTVLLQRFPRVKPGRADIRRERASPFLSNSSDSLYSNDDRTQRNEHLRERLTKDLKECFQNEIHMLNHKLEEIKSAVIEHRKEPQYV